MTLEFADGLAWGRRQGQQDQADTSSFPLPLECLPGQQHQKQTQAVLVQHLISHEQR